MNANELIELRNKITGIHNGINAEDLKLLYDLLPAVDALSRSRICNTATEPPTKEESEVVKAMRVVVRRKFEEGEK